MFRFMLGSIWFVGFVAMYSCIKSIYSIQSWNVMLDKLCYAMLVCAKYEVFYGVRGRDDNVLYGVL